MSGPLNGMSVLITRPEHQADGLKATLQGMGATVILAPVISVVPVETGPLDEALGHLERYDWIVLTSANGVAALSGRMKALKLPGCLIKDRRLAAIGPATARALEGAFRAPDVTPDEFVSEAIADAIPEVKGQRFLLARADLATRGLAQSLRKKGGIVDEVVAYKIVRRTDFALPNEMPDAITLTSAEVVRATVQLLESSGREDWLRTSALICIGPITAAALEELGLAPSVVARTFDSRGLIEAILRGLSLEPTHA